MRRSSQVPARATAATERSAAAAVPSATASPATPASDARAAVAVLLALLLAAATAGLAPQPARAAQPAVAPIAADDWYAELTRARADAGLPALTERADWNDAAELHARYATRNGWFAHDEDPSLPGHTEEGRFAARTGNLLRSQLPVAPRDSVRVWLNSPSHARWLLHWQVRDVGYGDHHDPDAPIEFVSVLPIIGTIDLGVPQPARYSYPSDGGTVAAPPVVSSYDDYLGLRTFYLFRADLPGAAGSAFSARVVVDGAAQTADVTYLDDSLAVQLASSLPPDADVEVVVRRDGADYDRWRFTTVAIDAAAAGASDPGSVEAGDAGDDAAGGDATADREPLWDAVDTTHEAAIRAMVDAGVVSGYADGSFGPNDPVTRGQLSSMLVGALDLDVSTDDAAVDAASHGLVDVDDTTHEHAVVAVVSEGIAAGYPDGTFRPGDPVTRGQAATFLANAFGLEVAVPQDGSADAGPDGEAAASDASVAGLDDVAGSVHAAAIAAVVDAGFAVGFPDGTFRPSDPVTRGQMVTMLVRGLGVDLAGG